MAVYTQVTSQSFIVSFTGLDAVWAVKRRLVIDRQDIVSAKVASRKECVSLLRWRLYGSFLPGLVCAGTFSVSKKVGSPRGSRAFMSMHRAKQVLLITTSGKLAFIGLEVLDAAAVVDALRSQSR
jgi:hypothetical protein